MLFSHERQKHTQSYSWAPKWGAWGTTCSSSNNCWDCHTQDSTNALVRVKVNTGAGGNVMPLSIYEQLYPRKINYKGEPIGLETSTTHLTAYNRTPILQYGTLRCLLTWRPGNGEKPRRIQSKWYVTDTPGSAIQGLPSCKRLKVITLNCVVRITHVTPVTLDKKYHAINGIDWHAGTIPQKTGRIISREQLIQEYSDCFKGVGRFPGTCRIYLKKGATPSFIHSKNGP